MSVTPASHRRCPDCGIRRLSADRCPRYRGGIDAPRPRQTACAVRHHVLRHSGRRRKEPQRLLPNRITDARERYVPPDDKPDPPGGEQGQNASGDEQDAQGDRTTVSVPFPMYPRHPQQARHCSSTVTSFRSTQTAACPRASMETTAMPATCSSTTSWWSWAVAPRADGTRRIDHLFDLLGAEKLVIRAVLQRVDA
jgi:hypothetical protein